MQLHNALPEKREGNGRKADGGWRMTECRLPLSLDASLASKHAAVGWRSSRNHNHNHMQMQTHSTGGGCCALALFFPFLFVRHAGHRTFRQCARRKCVARESGGGREREGQPGCAFPIRFRRCACPLAKPSCNFRTRLLAKHLCFPSPEAAARKISHRHLLRHPAPSRACRMQEGTRDCSSPNPPCSNKANQSYGIEETTTHRQ